MNLINLSLEGIGGEIIIGELSKKQARIINELLLEDLDNPEKILKNKKLFADNNLPDYTKFDNILHLKSITTSCRVKISNKIGEMMNVNYYDLESDYSGFYNNEYIIASSLKPEEHKFSTQIFKDPLLYTYSQSKGEFFKTQIRLADSEKFDPKQLSLVVTEVKIINDFGSIFSQDFISEIRYKDQILKGEEGKLKPVEFKGELICADLIYEI